MNYSEIFYNDFVNGEGCRIALFVSGCSHACEGCYNKATWNPKAGQPFDIAIESKIFSAMTNHDGLSLSGGDPLHKKNYPHILRLCRTFKAQFPTKDIWLWTGDLFSTIPKELLSCLDVVIDGEYEKDNTPCTKPWRGSNNQKLWRKVVDDVWEAHAKDNY